MLLLGQLFDIKICLYIYVYMYACIYVLCMYVGLHVCMYVLCIKGISLYLENEYSVSALIVFFVSSEKLNKWYLF